MSMNKGKIILERRARVTEMYLQGVPQFKIAEALGVSKGQISQDLKKLSQAWKQSAIIDMDEIKQKELSKVDLVEKNAWEAWHRSCDVKTKKSMKKKGSSTKLGKALGNEEKEQSFTEEQQIGDPRFLEQIMKCVAKREEILGYGAAKKVDLTSKGDKLQGGSVIVLPSNGREVIEEVINQE